MKNPTVVLKTSKFDVPKVILYVVLYKLHSRKLLPSAIGIDHFLDTRTIKIQARNCFCNILSIVKEASTPCMLCLSSDICTFICAY